MKTARKTRDLCQTCWEKANEGQYAPMADRLDVCAECGQDALVTRSPVVDKTGTHYIAMLTGLKYQIVGLGATEAEAKKACISHYHRTNNSGYGFDFDGWRVYTQQQVEDYMGIDIYGPLTDGQAQTE